MFHCDITLALLDFREFPTCRAGTLTMVLQRSKRASTKDTNPRPRSLRVTGSTPPEASRHWGSMGKGPRHIQDAVTESVTRRDETQGRVWVWEVRKGGEKGSTAWRSHTQNFPEV